MLLPRTQWQLFHRLTLVISICYTSPNKCFDGALRENYPERMPLLRKPLYYFYFLNVPLIIKSVGENMSSETFLN